MKSRSLFMTLALAAILTLGVLWLTSNPAISQATTAVVVVRNQHTEDPAFASDGCHLTTGSAATEEGVDTGATTDTGGEPRLGNPDLGADEY